jgi:hypothetical protein
LSEEEDSVKRTWVRIATSHFRVAYGMLIDDEITGS